MPLVRRERENENEADEQEHPRQALGQSPFARCLDGLLPALRLREQRLVADEELDEPALLLAGRERHDAHLEAVTAQVGEHRDEPLHLVREDLEVAQEDQRASGLTLATQCFAGDLQALGDPRPGSEAIPRVRWKEAGRGRAEEPQQRLELASRRARREQLVGDVREHDEPCALVRAHELAHGRLEAALEDARGEVEHDDAARAGGDERSVADVVLARDEHRRTEQEREAAGEARLAGSSCACPSGAADPARSPGWRAVVQAEGAWPSLISSTSSVISSVAGDGGDQPCARARSAVSSSSASSS